VDPAGKNLAISGESDITLVNIARKFIVARFSAHEISQSLYPHPEGNLIDDYGLSWSPDGTALALSVSTKPYSMASDGIGPAQCVVIYLKKRIFSIGMGAPVAWISNNEVLCEVPAKGGSGFRSAILTLDGRGRRQSLLSGAQTCWDGSHILMSKRHGVEILDRENLSSVGFYRIANLENSRPVLMPRFFVGIPMAAALRFGKVDDPVRSAKAAVK